MKRVNNCRAWLEVLPSSPFTNYNLSMRVHVGSVECTLDSETCVCASRFHPVDCLSVFLKLSFAPACPNPSPRAWQQPLTLWIPPFPPCNLQSAAKHIPNSANGSHTCVVRPQSDVAPSKCLSLASGRRRPERTDPTSTCGFGEYSVSLCAEGTRVVAPSVETPRHSGPFHKPTHFIKLLWLLANSGIQYC
jgi:hypothetical protein